MIVTVWRWEIYEKEVYANLKRSALLGVESGAGIRFDGIKNI